MTMQRFAQKSLAASKSLPLQTQVKQVAKWFTGFFDNSEQVASNFSVPLLAMFNCRVQLIGDNKADETQNVYVEQKSVAFKRMRFYSFSQGNSAVKLSIYKFVNQELLHGVYHKPASERVVEISNLVATNCDLFLMKQSSRYIGTNAPDGYNTSSNSKVVSNVVIWDCGIDSLDQIFNAKGNLIFGTPIEFRRIYSIFSSAQKAISSSLSHL